MHTLSHPGPVSLEAVRQKLNGLLRRVGRRQSALLLVRAALTALAAALAAAFVLLVVDLVVVLAPAARAGLRWLPIIIGAAAAS
jgi:hypothetical protein